MVELFANGGDPDQTLRFYFHCNYKSTSLKSCFVMNANHCQEKLDISFML